MAIDGMSNYMSSKKKTKQLLIPELFFSFKTFHLPKKRCGVCVVYIFSDFCKLWE